jgi:hypothetical protein
MYVAGSDTTTDNTKGVQYRRAAVSIPAPTRLGAQITHESRNLIITATRSLPRQQHFLPILASCHQSPLPTVQRDHTLRCIPRLIRFALIVLRNSVDNSSEKPCRHGRDRAKCDWIPKEYHSRRSNWQLVQSADHTTEGASGPVISWYNSRLHL